MLSRVSQSLFHSELYTNIFEYLNRHWIFNYISCFRHVTLPPARAHLLKVPLTLRAVSFPTTTGPKGKTPSTPKKAGPLTWSMMTVLALLNWTRGFFGREIKVKKFSLIIPQEPVKYVSVCQEEPLGLLTRTYGVYHQTPPSTPHPKLPGWSSS